jgi:DNA repair/transcription protein MET18/MMS19
LQVFQPVDPQAESDALNTIQVLIKTIYEENSVATTSTDNIKGLAREASEECIQILKEPEKSQARPATKILCVFMSTTRMPIVLFYRHRLTPHPAYVARYTISQVVPHFIQLFHNPDEGPTRLGTLTLLCEVVDSARSSVSQDNGAALMPFKDEVLGLYIAGLQTTSLRTVALSGLKGLALTDGLLADDEIGYVVHKVNGITAIDQDDSEETRLVALSALTLYSDTLFIAKRSWRYSRPLPNEPHVIL